MSWNPLSATWARARRSNTYTPLAGYHVLGDPVVVTATGYEVLIETERKLFSTDEGMQS